MRSSSKPLPRPIRGPHSLGMLVGCWLIVVCGLACVAGQAVEDTPDESPASKQPSAAASEATVAAPPASLWTRTNGVDWPAFLGPTGDSKSPETGILTEWPAEGPRIVWQTTLGTSYGAPTISAGRLFHFDRYRDAARLTCRNAETGEFLWKFEYPTDYEDMYGYNNGPRCCPVVDDDRVYTFGAEGLLHCLAVADGKEIWKCDTAAQFGVIQNFFGVGSTPVIEGDLLIAMIGGSPPEDKRIPPGQLDRVVGNGSGIVAFDKRTGEVQYQITDELASYAGPALATIDGRRWCFAFARGGLVGFDPASGQVDFQYPWRSRILESVNASNPVIVDDQVLISETYGPGSSLLRVKPGGYDVAWTDEQRGRDKALQTHWNTAVYVDGHVYASSGRHKENAELRCVELATGEVKWSEPDLTRSSLLYVDGHFVCLTEVGRLLLLKATPERFDPVADVTLRDTKKAGPFLPSLGPAKMLKEPAWAAPILSHGLLYLRGDDRLVCLELIPEKQPKRTD